MSKRIRRHTVVESRPNGLPPMKITHHGFSCKVAPMDRHVAIVAVEDSHEVWAVDDLAACDKLIMFLMDEYGPCVKLVGFFTRDERRNERGEQNECGR